MKDLFVMRDSFKGQAYKNGNYWFIQDYVRGDKFCIEIGSNTKMAKAICAAMNKSMACRKVLGMKP